MVDYDPAVEADAYYQRIEKSWMDEREDAQCRDCVHCYCHDVYQDVAFCVEFNEFIDPCEFPGVTGIECERFSKWY